MNKYMLWCGAFVMIAVGSIVKEASFIAVGLGLLWVGNAVNAK